MAALLDLFCAAGGASEGYRQAGFDRIVGVDWLAQPHYPFEFIESDVFDLGDDFLRQFDAIHASPPCQVHTKKVATWGRKITDPIEHQDFLPQTRMLLDRIGKPYVIENVDGAPLRGDMMLCGTMFGLRIIKHRYFETSWPIFELMPSCDHRNVYNPWAGKGRTADKFREAQGTPWIPMAGGASRRRGDSGDLYNAIPPAFTKWIGGKLLDHLRGNDHADH